MSNEEDVLTQEEVQAIIDEHRYDLWIRDTDTGKMLRFNEILKQIKYQEELVLHGYQLVLANDWYEDGIPKAWTVMAVIDDTDGAIH